MVPCTSRSSQGAFTLCLQGRQGRGQILLTMDTMRENCRPLRYCHKADPRDVVTIFACKDVSWLVYTRDKTGSRGRIEYSRRTSTSLLRVLSLLGADMSKRNFSLLKIDQ